jgi:hypothetical protein
MSTASRHPACLGYPGNESEGQPSIFFVATREKCTFYVAKNKGLDIHTLSKFST